ncbi:MAG: dihydroorotate dehydrogenase electron transfer subunit [Clostridiales bacterium]|nr:dihydroorotate dehydrogenase electron transfer subunit [Clostridiales bacterium]
MKDYIATIVKNEPIADNVYAITFDLGEPAKARCGQFGNISVGGTHLLRRPIAICKLDGNTVTFCYQIKGEGTQRLKTLGVGEKLNVLMPLGNGFYVEENEKKIALVGGGVGVFPLISVLREYGMEKEISAYIGYRNKGAVCGVEEFEKAYKFVAVTDDGSYGEKMNAVQAFQADLAKGKRPDVVLACGPTPMLRALIKVVKEENLPCYVSLEERMGCGIGACLVCVCDMTNGKKARVCKDGPVFSADSVVL